MLNIILPYYCQPWLPIFQVYQLHQVHGDVYEARVLNDPSNPSEPVYVHPLTLNIVLPDLRVYLWGTLEDDIFYTHDADKLDEIFILHSLYPVS
jgi:hypothetical protein